jgi:hypothetical protein
MNCILDCNTSLFRGNCIGRGFLWTCCPSCKGTWFCAEVNNYCCWIFYFIWCICKNDILVTVTILERMKTVMILKVRFVYTSLDTKNVYISWANIYEYGYSVQRFRIWTRTPSSSDVWQIKIKGYTAESLLCFWMWSWIAPEFRSLACTIFVIRLIMIQFYTFNWLCYGSQVIFLQISSIIDDFRDKHDCNKIGTGGSPCRLSAVYPFIFICHTSLLLGYDVFVRMTFWSQLPFWNAWRQLWFWKFDLYIPV